MVLKETAPALGRPRAATPSTTGRPARDASAASAGRNAASGCLTRYPPFFTGCGRTEGAALFSRDHRPTKADWQQEELVDKAKPFDIPKREVWEALKKVKANQGAAGVDGQTIADFEADLSNNLYGGQCGQLIVVRLRPSRPWPRVIALTPYAVIPGHVPRPPLFAVEERGSPAHSAWASACAVATLEAGLAALACRELAAALPGCQRQMRIGRSMFLTVISPPSWKRTSMRLPMLSLTIDERGLGLLTESAHRDHASEVEENE